ncbi:molybdopterin cofactor-binding domain-containing protein [Pseudanabaena mucicola]|uniref:Molybdopterin-dependent oxidoreductase n=1 Tax=Pseudanabaena mucicola FACHB-723 TaxID=2692860 RepID=A0ABR7ZWZ2_9CYAN|nr:molybdopterin cofactor-binding domain-containing protein [Pseudanabaena mucicola]MBD2188030.1 molybdopterin-dependent oxidoreductase [Pseudanabaena mucicola FACHB-723]
MQRIDAHAHVRSEAEFVDDVPSPSDMLYAAVFGSPIAKGKILNLHTKLALATDGVVEILTADDIPQHNQWGTIAECPILASHTVSYVGQPIAVVVAKTKAIAQKATKLISIQLEKFTPVVNPREAFSQGNIIGTQRTFALGDVDIVWADCDVIVEGSCEVGGQEHLYLETQRARVSINEHTLHVHASTQNPHLTQETIAKMLGIPNHAVQVDVKRLGGGFGGKEEQATHWASLAALAAWHTNHAVELVLSRSDDMRMTGKRHPYSSDFKIGATKDGKILAYAVQHYQNSGAYADLSLAILERSLFHSTNAYYIPNVRIFAAACRTNLPPNTAMRGFGAPQAMFVIESAIAKLADALDMPREEVQAKNLLQPQQLLPYGQQFQSDGLQTSWQKAIKNYDLASIRDRITNYNASHFATKKGYAVMPICFGISFTATFLNQASALVHIYTDGSVSISTGGVEMGQGLSTKLTEIAATALGIKPERIKIESTNTTRIANMSASAASVTTDLNGNATLLATNQILERLKVLAAQQLGVTEPTQIAIADEKIFYEGRETELTWTVLAKSAHLEQVNLSAHGFYTTPEVYFDRDQEKGHPFAYHVCGTAIVEVTLDCLRGTYGIDAVKIVHDLGRSLNDLVDRGQVEGALAQGLGWMTIEDLQFSAKGHLLANNLAKYKVPDIQFMPKQIAIAFLENPDNQFAPYGSKAVGEPPLMYGIGVFFALRQAMQSFNLDSGETFHAPLTPERVLLALY